MEASDAAKLFEEIKVMFRDLPGHLSESLSTRGRRRRRWHPEMFFEMLHEYPPDVGWLVVISALREDAPWIYELGLDVYKALKQGNSRIVAHSIERFERTMASVRHGSRARYLIDSPEVEMAVHELGRIAHHVFLRDIPDVDKQASPKDVAKKVD